MSYNRCKIERNLFYNGLFSTTDEAIYFLGGVWGG